MESEEEVEQRVIRDDGRVRGRRETRGLAEEIRPTYLVMVSLDREESCY